MRAGCGMGGGNAVLSDVGRDRTPGIQSLAKRRSGYTGQMASVGPVNTPCRRLPAYTRFALSGERVLLYDFTVRELCSNHAIILLDDSQNMNNMEFIDGLEFVRNVCSKIEEIPTKEFF